MKLRSTMIAAFVLAASASSAHAGDDVTIKTSSGKTYSFSYYQPGTTVCDVKKFLEGKTRTKRAEIDLQYRGKSLNNNDTLKSAVPNHATLTMSSAYRGTGRGC